METMNFKTADPIAEENLDHEVRTLDTNYINESHIQLSWWHDLKFIPVGIFFGILLVKSEVISWYRIQEMFRLQSFHMYGVIGSAVVVGMLSVIVIKKRICVTKVYYSESQ